MAAPDDSCSSRLERNADLAGAFMIPFLDRWVRDAFRGADTQRSPLSGAHVSRHGVP